MTFHMAVLDRILRAGEGKKVKALAALVPEINALEPAMVALDDEGLRGKTAEFKSRLARGEDLDDLMVEVGQYLDKRVGPKESPESEAEPVPEFAPEPETTPGSDA